MQTKAGLKRTSARTWRCAAALGVALIEQPLPAGKRRDRSRQIARPVPVCADESVHDRADLETLVGLYDAVNIKLDKAGGLTAALALRDAARARSASRSWSAAWSAHRSAMAPAVLLAQDADFVDLDGPLLLARDRSPGLTYSGSLVSPPDAGALGLTRAASADQAQADERNCRHDVKADDAEARS